MNKSFNIQCSLTKFSTVYNVGFVRSNSYTTAANSACSKAEIHSHWLPCFHWVTDLDDFSDERVLEVLIQFHAVVHQHVLISSSTDFQASVAS